MAIVYIIGSLVVIFANIGQIGDAVGSIFYYAFNPHAAVGGFAGSAVAASIRFGIARGIFSNEAGLGAASIVHAQAKNSPTQQSMWGVMEVFIDTIVVCTMTALVILVTGVIETGDTGAGLASAAFNRGLPGPGGSFRRGRFRRDSGNKAVVILPEALIDTGVAVSPLQ
jgi:alanine or glycine:cation symporter, AGCS family